MRSNQLSYTSLQLLNLTWITGVRQDSIDIFFPERQIDIEEAVNDSQLSASNVKIVECLQGWPIGLGSGLIIRERKL